MFSYIAEPISHVCAHFAHPSAYSSAMWLTTIKVFAAPRAAVNPTSGFLLRLCHQVIYLCTVS